MNLKIIASLLVLFMIGINCHSQSIYFFRYEMHNSGDTVSYRAFFERDADGTGFIRVKYYDKTLQQDVLIEMNTEDSYNKDKNGKSDSSILFFPGYYPEVINGDKNTNYLPQIFWFKKDTLTGYYEPWGVTTQDGNLDGEATFTEARLLRKEDLTKELVSDFFNKDEGLYENLFDTLSVRPVIPMSTAPATLHLLIVANTLDNSIGSTCTKDKDRTLQAFTDLAEYLEVKLDTPAIIFGKNYNKMAVELAINLLDPAPNDIVVFYYSGHGYNITTDKSQYPYLDLRSKNSQPLDKYSLNIQDIYTRIKKKGARLNLVFSDCCNADPYATTMSSSNVALTRSTSIGWSKENCAQLFLNDKPVSVLMSAASKGELSAGNNDLGGIFTFNFRESLESSFGLFNKNPSWKALLEQAQKQTIKRVSQSVCPQPDGVTFKTCVQNPVFIIE